MGNNHIKVAKTHRVLSWLAAIVATGFLVALFFNQSGDIAGILVLSAVFSVLHHFIAQGASRKETWARITSIVMSVFMLLAFPLGTAIAVYLLINNFKNWHTEAKDSIRTVSYSVGYPRMESNEVLWSAALAEFESQSRRQGLWARLFAESGGNEPAAKAAYLTVRVAEMENEPPAFITELRNKGYQVELIESKWHLVSPNRKSTLYFSSMQSLETEAMLELSNPSMS